MNAHQRRVEWRRMQGKKADWLIKKLSLDDQPAKPNVQPNERKGS